MDGSIAVWGALTRAIDDVEGAIWRVRGAQQVDWVSVFGSRFREELYGAIQDLSRLASSLESLRAGLA
jgi:hypothetical protein